MLSFRLSSSWFNPSRRSYKKLQLENSMYYKSGRGEEGQEGESCRGDWQEDREKEMDVITNDYDISIYILFH